MSYILKRAITKPKHQQNNQVGTTAPKSKKGRLTNKEDPSKTKRAEDSSSFRPLAPTLLRSFGDIFIVPCHKEFFIFESLNEVKQIRELIIKKADFLFEFNLEELCRSEEQAPLNKLSEVVNEKTDEVFQLIEKIPSVDFELFGAGLKKEINAFYKESDDLFLRCKDGFAMMLFLELSQTDLQLQKVSFNVALLKFIHNVDQDKIEKVMRKGILPNFLRLPIDVYYDIIKFAIDLGIEEGEKKLKLDLITDDQFSLHSEVTMKKSLYYNVCEKKCKIMLFFSFGYDSSFLKDIEKQRKKRILSSQSHSTLHKENWADLIDRYYMLPETIQPEQDPISESKRCRFKLIE